MGLCFGSLPLLQRIKDQGSKKDQGSRIKDQGRMVEEKQDGLDWCLGEQGQPGYRCLGPSTVIVLFYAVGCIVFGFLVSLVVMQMDKSKAKKRKRSMDQNGANLESKWMRKLVLWRRPPRRLKG